MNVTYVSACLDSSGYAEAARNHIAALNSQGVRINAVPISFEGYRSDLGPLGVMIQGMIKKNHPGKIRIIHATPENFARYGDTSQYQIGYCTWETDRLPPKWTGMINRMNEIWVPSEYNKVLFENSGVTKPIFVMPHPFDTRSIQEQDSEIIKGVVSNLNKNDFMFYSIFQWIERKNPVDLLKAYLTEFKEEENVVLVLKTYLSNPNKSNEAEKIREAIREVKANLHMKNHPKILMISSLLSKGQIKALHNRGDCYVSLNRCEGFGIPLAEAMLEKKPVIATGYGGPVDFMQTQKLVKYDITPVYGMPWSHYTGDMCWAQPDLMDARKKMRWMFENQKKAKKIGEDGYSYICENLSWEIVGKKMKDRLEAIANG